MREDAIKLLEDRVLKAAARMRDLRAERDERGAECEALRVRIDELERARDRVGHDDRSPDFRRIREALRDAIRDLRGDEDSGGDSAADGGPERSE